ncbi:MAG: CoA pyrophosphatase [Alicyclobacillus macrosporangiidus]|uniref:NUDIX hydrolase n=1 Tax=Alicyclobacillus macrosporangiidus TaxID=392015 RepID=UPI0026ED487A|nr:CoA pyrophosphatase [Alicyclobacillus macrosporangiidus]MCL6597774.1 CoA pyrophosphatase [Alicyclobacillus macrosporangiidus]
MDRSSREHPATSAIRQVLEARQPGILTEEPVMHAAVLVPLVNVGGELAVLFEQRAATLRRQAGEICFPGGRCEPDDSDERAAALRETCEELGITASDVDYLGALDVLVASPQVIVHPFVGCILDTARLRPNPDEVGRVFTVPIERLLQTSPRVVSMPFTPAPPDDFPFHLIPHGPSYPWRGWTRRIHFYEVDGWVIWGMTARILTHFLDLVRDEM